LLRASEAGQWLAALACHLWHTTLQPSPPEKEENSFGIVIKKAWSRRAISTMGLKTDRLQLAKMTRANVH
jgi:hypothetical protein